MILMKHPEMQDVAVHIVNETIVPYPDQNWVHLSVLWYNIHGHKHFGTPPFLIDDEFQLLKMPLDQFKKWVPYDIRAT